MLINSEGYLNAITRCDFLLAAEFPEFIAKKYSESHVALDGDNLLTLLVYELIQAAVVPVWMDIQLLYALILDEESLFQDRLAYSATLVMNALVQTLIIIEQNQQTFYFSDKPQSVVEVLEWMQRESPQWSAENNNLESANKFALLEKGQGLVFDRIENFKEKTNEYQNYDIKLRFYQARLAFEKGYDPLAAERLMLIKALQNHFKHFRQISAELFTVMKNIVGELRRLAPRPWEKEILDFLAPRGFFDLLVDSSLRNLGFFSLRTVGGLLGEAKISEQSENRI